MDASGGAAGSRLYNAERHVSKKTTTTHRGRREIIFLF